jgi:Reverse transcriptase (RNA-dependent DNA polymerase).
MIGSKSLTKLQNTVDEVEKWCTQHKFVINAEKTEVMMFRSIE